MSEGINKESGIMPNPGDVIWVNRDPYSHCGIFEGPGVIHFAAEEGEEISAENALIHRSAFEDFARGDPVKIVKFTNCFTPEETLRRARSRLGEKGYDFFTNNCDHFATWCKTGEHCSVQVEDVKATLKELADASGSETAKVLADIICTAHDMAQNFKPPTFENQSSGGAKGKIEVGRILLDANELNSAVSENYIPMQDEEIADETSADEISAEEIPPDETADAGEYPDLQEYENEDAQDENKPEDDGEDDRGGDEAKGSGGNKKLSKIDFVTDKIKGVVYAVSGAIELLKPRLPPILQNIPFKAIGAKVANIVDKIGIGIKVFAKILTPAEGKMAMQNADTALLGKTVREKSAVPVGERVKTVFGKVGTALKQVVHTVVDNIVPQPVRKAITTGFKKVGTAIVSGVKSLAQKAGGFLSRLKTKIFG
ncbi:hypothetical protein FACS1894137_06320 [Spirochaetia bacterium]|nr:hypothetical protein FACS1894137_06320 [Spirochaetia bacterium]